jgi:hypothetical protein
MQQSVSSVAHTESVRSRSSSFLSDVPTEHLRDEGTNTDNISTGGANSDQNSKKRLAKDNNPRPTANKKSRISLLLKVKEAEFDPEYVRENENSPLSQGNLHVSVVHCLSELI